jgi:hypothetical protein
MAKPKRQFISLTSLAAEISLPKAYIVELADKGLIPSLDVNGRLRFNITAVQQALDKLASKGGHDDH